MYKIAWCPLCEQGWVVIVKDKHTSQLYAYCTECETEWNDPAKGIKGLHPRSTEMENIDKMINCGDGVPAS